MSDLNRIKKLLQTEKISEEELKSLLEDPFSDQMMESQWNKEPKAYSGNSDALFNRILTNLNPPATKPRLLLSFLKLAAVLVFGLFCFFAGSQIQHKRMEKSTINQFVAVRGERSEFRLPDGSRVWLNSASRIIPDEGFGNINRDLSLVGEAYFMVEKNALPFRVKMKHNTVTALGTQFYLNSELDAETLSAGLVEGSIRIESATGTSLTLNKPETLILNASSEKPEYRGALRMSQYSWKSGVLVFEDISLFEISRRLTNWFNITVEVDHNLESQRFTLTVKDESLEEVLELISLASDLEFEKTAQGYRIKKPKG